MIGCGSASVCQIDDLDTCFFFQQNDLAVLNCDWTIVSNHSVLELLAVLHSDWTMVCISLSQPGGPSRRRWRSWSRRIRWGSGGNFFIIINYCFLRASHGNSYYCWVVVGGGPISPDRCRQEKSLLGYVEGGFQMENVKGLPQPQATSVGVLINDAGAIEE